jgi:hypothetical protein
MATASQEVYISGESLGQPDFDTTPAYRGRVSLKRAKPLMRGDA